MKFHIITRSTRLKNLKEVKKSVFENLPTEIKVNWHVMFDTNTLKDIDADLLHDLKDENTEYYFKKGDAAGMLYPQSSELISTFTEGWVYFLDDDNLIHESFYEEILKIIKRDESKMVHTFSQNVDGKDFTGLKFRMVDPSNIKKHKIDLAQFIVHSEVYNKHGYKFEPDYCADGILIEQVHKDHPEWFTYTIEELCHYNLLEKRSEANVPKILYIAEENADLKSLKMLDYEADNLNVKWLKDDKNIAEEIAAFKPDAIVSRAESWESFPNMARMSSEFRRKWMNIPLDICDRDTGQAAYQFSMETLLSPDGLEDSELISYFTPIYNTGQKLYQTYESVRTQTNPNWEWILVNDSSDGGRTLKIAEDIASRDPRVKVFDFREKSGGNIGEVKWRCCTMAKGFILAELDHDDLLVPWCTDDLYKAAKKHPEAGFFFNDTLEVDENFVSLTYDDGFAFDYGSYRTEEYNGVPMQVCTQHNLNPKTIRHIVGVPNHVRAWRRSTYFEIGGHNRNLPTADDYELVVRTFLKTITCKIPKLGYIQFLYNNASGQNTHDMARDDIQRRVRTISYFYNEQIKERFEELGLTDWAYEEHPDAPLFAESRFGEEEMAANITYIEE